MGVALACVMALAGVLSLAVRGAGGEPPAETPSEAAREPAAERTVRLPILMYHHIAELDGRADPVTRRYTVRPDDFAAQMEFLKSRGYTAVTPAQIEGFLLRGEALPERPVCVTFDDGWANQHEHAAPVLKRLGMPAVFYVYSNGVDAPGYMSAAQLRALMDAGMVVGSHTISHPRLPALSDEDARREIGESRARLEAVLGAAITTLAYPFGEFDERTVGLTREAGYTSAMTTEIGIEQRAGQVLMLRRVLVSYGDDLTVFARAIGAE